MTKKGTTNRRKGHVAERYYMNFFKALGFESCSTARFSSRKHDNAKIDLVDIPFNIQIKSGVQKNMNPGKELFMMESSIKAMFSSGDEVFSKPLLLFHYKQNVPGKRRTEEMEMVYMSFKQYKAFSKLSPEFSFDFYKEYSIDTSSDFKIIVGMSVEHFKQEIILKLYGTNNKKQ